MIVNRVEQHIISQKHPLFNFIDNYSFLTKNLYNYANYHVRQVFIITSKLSDGESITEEQQIFLDNINNKVIEYNKVKEGNFKKAKAKGKVDYDKKFEPLDFFHSDHKYINYDFLQFIMKDSKDYKAIMAQPAQQVLRLLDKNWISFFESIKDWSSNPDKYHGRPRLPKYKHKTNGRFNIIFTNQNCKLVTSYRTEEPDKQKDTETADQIDKQNEPDPKVYVKFPKCFNSFMFKTKVADNLQQVRIKPLGSQYMIEVVYTKELSVFLKSEPKAHELSISYPYSNRVIGIDLGVHNFVTIVSNI